jgi:hypothetical protein
VSTKKTRLAGSSANCYGEGEAMGGTGGGPQCVSDATMRADAEQSCLENHAQMTDFQANEACGAGASSSASWQCCAATPPPPPPPGCFGEGEAIGQAPGQPQQCESDAKLRADADQSCAASGATATTFTSDEKCGPGSSSSASWQCCGSPPPPPPPTCSGEGEAIGQAPGQPQQCESDAKLRADAEQSCAGRGASMSNFSSDEACGAGLSSSADWDCCDAPSPPHPPTR